MTLLSIYIILASMLRSPYRNRKPDIYECLKCGAKDGLTVGSTDYRSDGSKRTRYICRTCNAEKKRIERKRNPSAEYRAISKYRAKFPEKQRARELARRYVSLQPCEVCGDTKSVRHHEDYSKPLDVRFFCHLHHKQLHAGTL